MDKETLIEDMMRDAVTDAKLFRTYDDDYEVIDRDQVMRCLANLDVAIKQCNSIYSGADHSTYAIDAILSALTIMQNNLKKAVEFEAKEESKSILEMECYGGE